MLWTYVLINYYWTKDYIFVSFRLVVVQPLKKKKLKKTWFELDHSKVPESSLYITIL